MNSATGKLARRLVGFGFVATAAVTVANAAYAQTAASFPAKPIRIMVGFPPGGTSDILARAIGQKLTEAWGQPVIVENRPGAASNIAAEAVVRSAPNGYTLFIPTVPNVINVTLYPKLNYELMRDFAHITNMAGVPDVLVVHPSVPVKNARELVAIAKTRPDELRHGSTGIGSPAHLEAEIFKMMSGVKMTHVPYQGAAPALTDIAAGNIEVYFGALPSTLPFVQSNRLRPIAVTTLKRVPLTPNVPTLDEQGFKGFETESWFGVSAPAATPRDTIAKLNKEIVRIIALPEIRDRLRAQGVEFIGDTPEQFTAFLRKEIDKWGRAVKQSGAKAE